MVKGRRVEEGERVKQSYVVKLNRDRRLERGSCSLSLCQKQAPQ